MMIVLINSNTTGTTSDAGTTYPFGAHAFKSGFVWGLCYSIYSLLCNALLIIVSLLSLFIVLSVLRYTASDSPFGIFKLVMYMQYT